MEHTPVLLEACVQGLDVKPDGIYLDGTLGYGGHAVEIAGRLTRGRLIAIDKDRDALERAAARLSGFSDKITFVHGDFGDVGEILDENGVEFADGMLFDLGVSSLQLDNTERGFSYMRDAPLDMRMDRDGGITARDVVNTWDEQRLRRVFYEYGEEKYAAPITGEIVKRRAKAPIDTTFELNEAIISAMPASARRESQHPSKRCFQALRIVVNDELGSIRKMLAEAPGRLKTGGRLCVISFHSLEDRMCKQMLSEYAAPCKCPKDFPKCVCGLVPSMRIITKRPSRPDDDEIRENPRARSAKLRIAERI